MDLHAWFRTNTALAALLLVGSCGAPGPRDEVAARQGALLVTVDRVPSDVSCLELSVVGTRAVSAAVPVTPGEPAVMRMFRLPVGPVRLFQQAFAEACEAVGEGSIPTWASRVVEVTLTPGRLLRVSLVLRRNGEVEVTSVFEDDLPPDGGAVDAAPDAGSTPDAPVAPDAPAGPDARPPSTTARVLTQHNDLARTGANLAETSLTVASVNRQRFGRLFGRKVEGQIYAQPLFLPQAVGGRDAVFVATEHNEVYAFDADDPAAAAPLWRRNLGPTFPSTEIRLPKNAECVDLTPEIGITSTPVIDPDARTLFVSAKKKRGDETVYELHALDLATGAERPGSPVRMEASVTRPDGGRVTFDATHQLNRVALTLSRGVVHVGFASHCDWTPYYGWILSYDARTLAQVSAFNTAPKNGWSGIWMGGAGFSVDEEGALYFVTGNGPESEMLRGPAPVELGNAFVKVRAGAGGVLERVSAFWPHNWAELEKEDTDLGSSGVLLVPESEAFGGGGLVVGGGKEGVLYALRRDDLGGFRPGGDPPDPQAVWREKIGDAIVGSPVYWKGPSGPTAYVWPVRAKLRAMRVSPQGVETRTSSVPGAQWPGGVLSISADGARAGTGILWASLPNASANHRTVGGRLVAFDAEDVTRQLWDSEEVPARDRLPSYAKFTPPTVADGKVFMATFSDELVVYGLLDGPAPAPDAGAPAGGGPDAGPADAGVAAPTWRSIFDRHLGPGTAGHCPDCHTPSDAGTARGLFSCPPDPHGCYAGLVRSGKLGAMGDLRATLRWFVTDGRRGAMPKADANTPVADENPQAAADIEAWLRAGAPEN